jgi:AcrR family transcriptional regulator
MRQTILDAAGELLLEQGDAGFSLRKIAERIGYSATTIYRYFRNRDDLIFAVTEEGFRRFGIALQEAFDSENEPLERVRALGRAYIDFGIENPVYYRVMFMLRPHLLTERQPDANEARIDSFGLLRAAVEQAVRSGATGPRDAEAVSDALWAVVHGVVSLGITMPFYTRDQAREIGDLALEFCASGLRKK